MNKTLKKTIVYRFLSISSEYVIVFLATGNLLISGVVSLACILIHTGIYYGVEKRFK